MLVLATPYSRYDCMEEALGREGVEYVRLRTPDELSPERLASLRPRYIFFPHWSWKIPPEVFLNHECVIFHMTDLPFGRGGSPLQNLIVRGYEQTRLSALRCVEEMDAGPIYLKESLSLLGTAEEVLMRAARLMAAMMTTIIRTNPVPLPQEGEPTAFRRRRPQDGNIGDLDDLGKVFDFIRMLDGDGYPPAFLETKHFRLEFSRASLKPEAIMADVKIIRKSP